MNIEVASCPSRILTSWKEIAQYLNKGVRTVQRWEQDFGLPVRRPHGANKKAIIARTSDIDLWLATRCTTRISASAKIELGDTLRALCAELGSQIAMSAMLHSSEPTGNDILATVAALRQEMTRLALLLTIPASSIFQQTPSLPNGLPRPELVEPQKCVPLESPGVRQESEAPISLPLAI
ncbi:MAG TPA: hypothetical protein VHE33_09120 [Acidobacteriaceae bacterium]|nr:hypothetical protein [Acidobacteriaceae bacterium]